MKFQAIFFDMDGLLVDTESLYFQATQETYARIGIEFTREWYVTENLGKGRSSFDVAKEKGIPEAKIDELRAQRNGRYAELLQGNVQPIDGVREILETLKGKFVLGLVTSSRKDHFELIMQKTALRPFFDFFITGDDVEHVKPDPEPYVKAIKISGKSPSGGLVLEDSFRGVQAAKAAGLTCFAIPDALTRTQNFSIADKVLKSIREVPALLR